MKTTTPKSAKGRPIAALVDDLFTARQKRYEIQRQVKKMQEDESSLEDQIISELKKSKSTTGVAGKIASAQLVTKEKVVAEDWDDVWKYIVKNKAYDLVQRRLSDEAVKARWAEGEVIPGTNKLRIEDLSLSKL